VESIWLSACCPPW